MLFRNECEWRWKIDNIDKQRDGIFSVHMDFGTAVHGAIERHRTRKRAVDQALAVRIFRKYFSLLFRKNSHRYPQRDLEYDQKKFSDPKGFYLAAGENIIRRLGECSELAQAEVVHNEYPLYELIDRTDGLKISFKGYIDMIIKTVDGRGKPVLYICDFKTCSFGWDREKRQDRDVHMQVFLYKHFFCKKFNIDPSQVRTAFVLLKKRPPLAEKGKPETICPVEFFPVSAGPVSVQRAIDSLNETITSMREKYENETLVRNRENCINKFGDRCPYYNTPHCEGEVDLVELKIKEQSQPKKKVKKADELAAMREKVLKKKAR